MSVVTEGDTRPSLKTTEQNNLVFYSTHSKRYSLSLIVSALIGTPGDRWTVAQSKCGVRDEHLDLALKQQHQEPYRKAPVFPASDLCLWKNFIIFKFLCMLCICVYVMYTCVSHVFMPEEARSPRA